MKRFTARTRSGQDDGMALVSVVASMSLVMILLTIGLYAVLSNSGAARSGQDAKTAYAAAEAGLDEYVARLNATGGNYWTKGNTDPANPALAASGAGQRIQGTGTSGARYRYQVLNPADIASTGVIHLRVTGISGPGQAGTTGDGKTVTKTISALLEPAGFVRYVYFSDIEVLDPALMSSPVYVTVNGSSGPSSGRRYAMLPDAACGLHYYEGRVGGFTLAGSNPAVGVWNTSTNSWSSAPGSITSGSVNNISCLDINWGTGDTVAGGLHSNDTLLVNGGVNFSDPVTESSWPYCQSNPTANCWTGAGTPSNNKPYYAAPLALPQSNSALKSIAQDTTKNVGCYYTGATRITFTGSSMTVLSPNTTSAPSRCLNTANRANAQTISPIPQVIYVDQVSGSCSGVGYPRSGEWTGGVTTDYDCHRGTAFVQGPVTGQVTVAALDDIVVTGDLTYTGGTSGTDITGLVAGNNVWVYHPVTSSGNNLSGVTPVYRIEAALLALRHSFIVQNWAYGSPLSTGSASTMLNVTGSIAQKYRGPVATAYSNGTMVSGYRKNYQYDPRLLTLQPPYFLKPEGSPWSVKSLVDG